MNVPDLFAILKFDNKLRVTSANTLARKLLGLHKADLLSIHLRDFLIERYPNRDSLLEAVQTPIAEDEFITTRDVLLSPRQGNPFLARAHLAMQHTEDGQAHWSEMAFINIDDKKTVDETDISRELIPDRPHVIGEQVFYIQDVYSDKFIYMTSNCKRFLQLENYEILSNPDAFYRIIHRDDFDTFQNAKSESICNSSSFSMKLKIKNGTSEKLLHLRSEPVFNSEGSHTGLFCGVFWDITQTNKNDDTLLDIEKPVCFASITAELVHNLNNLLSIINLNCGLISGANLDKDIINKRTGIILKVTERATDITTSLMAISEARMLQPQVLDLNSAITGMLDLISASAGPAIELRYNLTEIPCPVRIDLSGFSRSLVNLLVKFRQTMPGGGTISISTTLKNAAKGETEHSGSDVRRASWVELCFRSNVPSMPPQVLEHPLEPYLTAKTAEDGRDIGLTDTHKFVKRAGGTITSECSPGCELAVCMNFPLVSSQCDGSSTTDPASAPSNLRAIK